MAELQFKRDLDGYFICPYNSECRCSSTNCEPCGWNPKVIKRRILELAEKFHTPPYELAKILPNEEAKQLARQK